MAIHMASFFKDTDFSLIKKEINNTGFSCLHNPFGAETLEKIIAEAERQFIKSKPVADDGKISYKSRLSDLGDHARELLTSSVMIDFLQRIFNEDFCYNPNSSCYTYYGEGDFLSPHKDHEEDCDVTVLIYIGANLKKNAVASPGMYLDIYKTAAQGQLLKSIRTDLGLIVVGRGSRHVHGRSPLAEGERMWMITACFIKNTK